jgi:hypothetical protein
MPRAFSRVIAILFVLSCCFASAQPAQHPAQPKPPQTPRQALLEIVTGGGKAIQKHLTVEIQQMIAQASKKKDASAKAGPDISMLLGELAGMPSLAGEKDLQTFESGPVLFSYVQRNEKQRIEVRVEGDDLSGNQDEIQLSIHLFKDGQEQSIPFMPNIIVGLKQQENTWRLSEIGGNAKLAVGDPKFFTDLLKLQQGDEQEAQQRKKPREEVTEKPERPRLPAFSIVKILAYAETSYAASNPEVGFTCNLADLAAVQGSGYPEILDPQVGTGTYNGYRFTVTGCDTKPAIVFHIIAEPLAVGSGSQAFCTDPTHNIRVSDDGRGGTCVVAGRVIKSEARFINPE